MAAYLFAELNIHDPEGYSDYPPQVIPMMAKYGGKLIHRIAHFETSEGDWNPTRLVVIEFPTKGDIRNFLNSEEYKPLKELRLRTTTSRVFFGEDDAPAGKPASP